MAFSPLGFPWQTSNLWKKKLQLIDDDLIDFNGLSHLNTRRCPQVEAGHNPTAPTFWHLLRRPATFGDCLCPPIFVGRNQKSFGPQQKDLNKNDDQKLQLTFQLRFSKKCFFTPPFFGKVNGFMAENGTFLPICVMLMRIPSFDGIWGLAKTLQLRIAGFRDRTGFRETWSQTEIAQQKRDEFQPGNMTSKTSDFSTHQFGANFDTRKGRKQVGPKNQFKVGL